MKYKKIQHRLNSMNGLKLEVIKRLDEYLENIEIDNDNSKTMLQFYKLIGDCIKNNNDDRITNLEKIIKENPEKFKNKKIASGEFVVIDGSDT